MQTCANVVTNTKEQVATSQGVLAVFRPLIVTHGTGGFGIGEGEKLWGPESGQGIRCWQERTILLEILILKHEPSSVRAGGGTSQTMFMGSLSNGNLFFSPIPLVSHLSAPDPGVSCSHGRRHSMVQGVYHLLYSSVSQFNFNVKCPILQALEINLIQRLAHCYLFLPIPAEMSGFSPSCDWGCFCPWSASWGAGESFCFLVPLEGHQKALPA